MGYEDSVYLAKLAEQAERYEGKSASDKTRSPMLIPPQRWSRT